MSPGAAIVLMNYLASIVATLGHAMVAWFLLSEFAFTVSKSSLGENLGISRMLLVPRMHAVRLGVALLASLLVMPAVWLVMSVA
jgi:hypothetical protein